MNKSDIQIAQEAKIEKISQIAQNLGLKESSYYPIGHYKAKIIPNEVEVKEKKKPAKLILVTAITPTPAGEGKTTTTVGLTDALNKIGKQTIAALREPSLGPVFGMKGGAAGGGYAQVVPMEDINLHFTGDFSAISLAHNLLSAMIDNHIYHGNSQQLDVRRIAWNRVVDMNDRALRHINVGLGGVANGYAREDSYDIVVASELMAILCLATSLKNLKQRIANITIGLRADRSRVTADDINATGAMSALLRDALLPNLVQTLENNPAIIHGGPFANIAHGCNSVIATQLARSLGDYVVTEAGFGADLGAEKFIDIKCRNANLEVDAIALVATIRALKYHGGVERTDLNTENLPALTTGFANLQKHLINIREHYGVNVVVAINRFLHDSDAEIQLLQDMLDEQNVSWSFCEHWAKGSEGAIDLAQKIVKACEKPSEMQFVYPTKAPLLEKIETVASKIYGASKVTLSSQAALKLNTWNGEFDHFPVCFAKTQYSFGTEPSNRGIPQSNERIHIDDLLLKTGAEFIVAIAGNMMTMPGLPKQPAAENIDIDNKGKITGLF